MSPKDLAPAHVREIAPYVPGKPIAETARELGMAEADILKLASNENPLGSSPEGDRGAARRAGRPRVLPGRQRPRPEGRDLGEARACAPENIVLGNGSNDVLELVARAFLTPRRFRRLFAATRSWSTRSRCRRSARAASRCRRRTTATTSTAMAARDPRRTRRSSSSPTRTTRPARSCPGRRSTPSSSACRPRCWSCWTRPTASTCPTSASRRQRAGSRASPTWSSRARSRRPTGSPGCASASGSRTRRSPSS